MQAILRGWLYVPYSLVGDIDALKRRLTYQPRRSMSGEARDPVPLYRDLQGRQMLGVPQAFGRRFWPDLEVVDETSAGEPMGTIPRLPDPNHPAVKEPDRQAKFMADMDRAVLEHKRFLAYAPTGSGKTVVGLRTAAVRGRKTLVVVHLARLRDQWIEEAKDKLGLPADRIGVAEGNKAQWEGKDVVVGMLQSIAYQPLRYPVEFYRSFGTVIYDEIHRTGAPVFSRAVWQFPAEVRIGLSATLKRSDDGGRVYYWHIGSMQVRSEQTALPIKVYPVWYDCGGYKLWGKDHGSRVKCLTMDGRRNRRIAKLVQKMYNNGRQALVVSEHVKHLQEIMTLARELGVPQEAMGQFTNEVHYVENVVQATGRVQPVARKRRQRAAELERIKRESQIIFATYGMIKEGIDIPRLDAGLDATPRGDATQLVGRIRRPHDGKKQPVLWVTMVDSNCDRSLRYFQSRLSDYTQSGAEVMDGIG